MLYRRFCNLCGKQHDKTEQCQCVTFQHIRYCVICGVQVHGTQKCSICKKITKCAVCGGIVHEVGQIYRGKCQFCRTNRRPQQFKIMITQHIEKEIQSQITRTDVALKNETDPIIKKHIIQRREIKLNFLFKLIDPQQIDSQKDK